MMHGVAKKKKKSKLVNVAKKKWTHRYREQNNGYQWGEMKGEGQYKGGEVRGTDY